MKVHDDRWYTSHRPFYLYQKDIIDLNSGWWTISTYVDNHRAWTITAFFSCFFGWFHVILLWFTRISRNSWDESSLDSVWLYDDRYTSSHLKAVMFLSYVKSWEGTIFSIEASLGQPVVPTVTHRHQGDYPIILNVSLYLNGNFGGTLVPYFWPYFVGIFSYIALT